MADLNVYAIPGPVLQDVLNYLGRQPYEEVAELVGQIKGSASTVENFLKTRAERLLAAQQEVKPTKPESPQEPATDAEGEGSRAPGTDGGDT